VDHILLELYRLEVVSWAVLLFHDLAGVLLGPSTLHNFLVVVDNSLVDMHSLFLHCSYSHTPRLHYNPARILDRIHRSNPLDTDRNLVVEMIEGVAVDILEEDVVFVLQHRCRVVVVAAVAVADSIPDHKPSCSRNPNDAPSKLKSDIIL
jgi:hypothetical protein